MGQRIFEAEHGYTGMSVESAENGGLHVRLHVNSGSLHGAQSVTIELDERDLKPLHEALSVWRASRHTVFGVGDTVYEPNTYKRAGKIISVLEDRLLYNAPYRVQFIDQAEGKPSTDYFSADDLVLVARKGKL